MESLRILIRRKDHSSTTAESVAKAALKTAKGAELHDIAETISKDPFLALKVIRIAGSPSFGAHRIQSVQHAVELLGYRQIASILISVAMAIHADEAMRIQGMDPHRFRMRSLVTAGLARLMAQKSSSVDPDLAYMAGLFADCGYLGISRFLPKQMTMIALTYQKGCARPLAEVEGYYLGFEHTEVGELMAEEYSFCSSVTSAIRWHHTPMMAGFEEQAVVDLVHLAMFTADQLGYLPFEACPASELDLFCCDRLQIDPEAFQSRLSTITDDAAAHNEMLDQQSLAA
jgi:HD-like signal output (HDOD) protein